MLEIKTNDAEAAAKIIVVGVGGAGNNAVNRMVDESIVRFFCQKDDDNRWHLPRNTTRWIYA